MLDSKRTEFDRMYSILGGLLFDIDLLNIYATREDYPVDLLSENELVINIVKFVKEVHREEHITITWNKYKDMVSRVLNTNVETLDDKPEAEAYYTIWEKAETQYLQEVKDKEYNAKWVAELKWLVEEYIKKQSMKLSIKKYTMFKQKCFSTDCDKPCDVVKECRLCKKHQEKPLDYIINHMEVLEQKLKSLRMASRGIVSISYGENLDERLARYDEEFLSKTTGGRTILGMSTGIPSIDMLTDGFLEGHIMAILARTGAGKSALVLQMAIDAWARENVNVLFINLEIPIWDIQKRLDTSLARVPYNSVRKADWKSEEDFNAFKNKLKALNQGKKHKFIVHDAYDLNISTMDQLIRSYYNMWGGGFIVVLDNLNRMSFPAGMAKHEGGNEICVKFHKLCKEFSARGVLVAQLNRSAEGITRPGLLNSSHVRDSDQLLDSVSTAFALVNHLGKEKKRVIAMKGRDFDMDTDIILENNLYRMRMEEVVGDNVNPDSDDFAMDDEDELGFT